MFDHTAIAARIALDCEFALERGNPALARGIERFRRDHADKTLWGADAENALSIIAAAHSGVSPDSEEISASQWREVAVHEGIMEVLFAWAMGNLAPEAATILNGITSKPRRRAA